MFHKALVEGACPLNVLFWVRAPCVELSADPGQLSLGSLFCSLLRAGSAVLCIIHECRLEAETLKVGGAFVNADQTFTFFMHT